MFFLDPEIPDPRMRSTVIAGSASLNGCVISQAVQNLHLVHALAYSRNHLSCGTFKSFVRELDPNFRTSKAGKLFETGLDSFCLVVVALHRFPPMCR